MTEVRGFSIIKQETEWLLEHGLPDKAIYQAGRGAETLDACLASFRGRVGKLVIAHDLRVLGETKKSVAAIMSKLEKARIRVVDIAHPGDTTMADMIQRASVAISGSRMRDRRAAKRMGAKGGLGRGVGLWLKRQDAAPKWLVDRIKDCREIPWELKLELLSPHFSEATLRRHYGANPTVSKFG